MEPQLRLEKYFFVKQFVTAIPSHDPSGVRNGTVVRVTNSIEPLADEVGAYGVEVTIKADMEKSKNPPYDFEVTAFGVLRVAEEEVTEITKSVVSMNATHILIGALRERLSDLTSRGPWSTFILGVLQLKAVVSDDGSQQSGESK